MAVGGNVGGSVLLDKDSDEVGKEWGYEWMPQKVVDEDDECTGDSRPDWLQN